MVDSRWRVLAQKSGWFFQRVTHPDPEEENAFERGSLPAVATNDAGFGREGGGVDRLVVDPLVAVRDWLIVKLLRRALVRRCLVQKPGKNGHHHLGSDCKKNEGLVIPPHGPKGQGRVANMTSDPSLNLVANREGRKQTKIICCLTLKS